MKLKRLDGFTFLELIFAITIMGVLFSLAITVIIGMIRFYTFTNTVRTNQQDARSIMNAISKDASNGLVVSADTYGSNKLCIVGNNEIINYKYVTDSANGNRDLVRITYPKVDSFKDCTLLEETNATTKNKLNGDRMYISNFEPRLLTRGAETVSDLSVTSLVFSANFVTSATANTVGSCSVGDIYCNSLNLNTAVKVRQKVGGI